MSVEKKKHARPLRHLSVGTVAGMRGCAFRYLNNPMIRYIPLSHSFGELLWYTVVLAAAMQRGLTCLPSALLKPHT